MDTSTLIAKVSIHNLDQLKLEVERSMEYIKYLTDRNILLPEDIQYGILASRMAEYVQSHTEIEVVVGEK